MDNERRTLVWDVPTRLLHWLMVLAFVGAFFIPQFLDDDSATFVWHMFFGGVVGFVVILRIVWGFVGSRWARFSSFRLHPGEVFGYFRDVLSGGARRYAGHNPASAAVSLLLLALGLAVPATGLWMSYGGEVIEEAHEILAWAFAGAAAIHIAGVLVDGFQHEDSIAMSMIDGRKDVDASDGIESSHAVAGMVVAALVGLWSWGLIANYDAANHRLQVPVVGASIPIGEEGDEEEDEGEGEYEGEEEYE